MEVRSRIIDCCLLAPTFQSCLLVLIKSSLVLSMAREEGLLTENTRRKAVPDIRERSRIAGN